MSICWDATLVIGACSGETHDSGCFQGLAEHFGWHRTSERHLNFPSLMKSWACTWVREARVDWQGTGRHGAEGTLRPGERELEEFR